MRPKRKDAGEIRIRVSKDDLKRIDFIMGHRYTTWQSVSAMVRGLIAAEVIKMERDAHGSQEKAK